MPRSTRPLPTLEEIMAVLRANLLELRERCGVRSLGVFGSYVRGEQRQRSDLDVLIDLDQTPTYLQLAPLQRELSVLAAIPVDLVLKRTLRPTIGKHILAEVVYL